MSMFSSVEREDVEPTCPYFHGTGDRTCKSGCWQEPICVTGEPLGGYRRPQHNEPNPILVDFRQDYDGDMRGWGVWFALWLYQDPPGLGSPEHIEHARRVLARLARLSEWADLEAAEAADDYRQLPIHRTEAGYPNCATCDDLTPEEIIDIRSLIG